MRCKFNKKINKSYQNFGFFLIYLQKRCLLTLLYKKNETKKRNNVNKKHGNISSFLFSKKSFWKQLDLFYKCTNRKCFLYLRENVSFTRQSLCSQLTNTCSQSTNTCLQSTNTSSQTANIKYNEIKNLFYRVKIKKRPR